MMTSEIRMCIYLFLLFFTLRIASAQNTCADRRATCINIRNCPPLIEILRRSRPLPRETLEMLRNLQCGFDGNDPKVCCVNESTPPPPTVVSSTEREVVPDPPDVTGYTNLRLLDHENCGPMSEQRIIGGNKTSIFDFPWMALIAYDTGRPIPEFRCGGTIISTRYILTAAHCVTTLPASLRLIGVRVGDHDISKELDCEEENELKVCAERYQDFGIDSVHFHPGYTRTKLQNDIALIRLNSSIDFRPITVKPICLPFGSAMMLNQKGAIVTGWGATEVGPRSQDLLQAKLPLITNEQCKEAYRRTAQIWYKQMCAGGQDMVDSCLGDSGGPLQAPSIYNNNDVRIVQYGVVSYGLRQCGTEGFPGVYTRIVYYMDWILNTMRD